MARFSMELPQDILNDVKRIERDSEKIFGGMTKAGAEVALQNVKANIPGDWKGSNIVNNIKLTKTYKTPSDDGINTKVIISGYFETQPDKNGHTYRHPAPLVANVYEYGSVKFPKKPFFRKSFRKAEIEKAMLQAQKELSGGLLDE